MFSISLDFLYLQEGDYGQAEKYADAAMAADRYNPHGTYMLFKTTLIPRHVAYTYFSLYIQV